MIWGESKNQSLKEDIMENVLALQLVETIAPQLTTDMAGSVGSVGCDKPN